VTRATVKIDNLKLDAALGLFADRWVNTMCRETSNSWAIRTPVDTGHLRASRLIKVTRKRTSVAGYVYTRVEYAPWVHDGRGPIVPVRAQALRFVINGRVVFAKKVGPAKAQPFARNALVAVARRHRLRVIHA